MKKHLVAAVGMSALLLGGCAQQVDYGNISDVWNKPETNVPVKPQPKPDTTTPVKPQPKPQPPQQKTDLNEVAENLTENMLASAAVKKITSGAEPVLFVSSMQNKTTSHVNSKQLLNTVKETVDDSGKFASVDSSRVKEVRQQLNFSSDDQLVNQSTAIQFGNMVGAQYMLYGSVSNTNKQVDGQSMPFYRMTMRLMDLKSGLIEWSDKADAPNTNPQGW
ncbi:TPA: penicillin-binding protein activator LpoB [Photobacterium damselae]|uniref:Penicillin-binding protein activator LpoB n=2 Tax=Photobacterium damselae TaxID=38293 RepID=A0ABD6X7K7_PHODM|nr:penicillin-binding protein activator LpoB [Photobacterium damselae]EJN6958472.1 penicillin-binding protein activator LpoB [Photobacterium damselae]KAB1506974.1 penicillin-binding protein activator LpoB [Photobacterium damselae subsp. damselae]MCG3844193.1 penicillin-binding protein activator LpoB [Photobacterium damselae]MCG9777930.1 penicillin-binding protein activator LpoB [Photobacterium damselae]NVH48984.1 penicillin-binding protein activator LpoB [Photobacterium damselae subsp. damsela